MGLIISRAVHTTSPSKKMPTYEIKQTCFYFEDAGIRCYFAAPGDSTWNHVKPILKVLFQTCSFKVRSFRVLPCRMSRIRFLTILTLACRRFSTQDVAIEPPRMKPFHPSILCKRLACLLLATWWGALSSKTFDDGNAVAETVETLFLQVALETGVTDANMVREPREQLNMTEEDLHEVVFMHIPYNFGHTIEKVAFLPESQAGRTSRQDLRCLFQNHFLL